MHRYAIELSGALTRTATSAADTVQVWQRATPALFRLAGASDLATRLDAAIGRYVYYPARAAVVRADIYHVLDHGYAQAALLLPWSRTVVTCHDLIPLLAAKGLVDMNVPATVRRTFAFRLWCLRQAAHVLADSQATMNGLVEHAGVSPDRVTVVPLGVSASFRPDVNDDARARIRRVHNLPADAPIVLQVGTGGGYKNTRTLLRAVARLRNGPVPQIRLARVGQELEEADARLVEELRIGDVITAVREVHDDATLAALYAAADVLAFPSLWEGFGLPPLEAMACGLPVVASNAASIPEVVGDAGILVDARDDQALASAIASVCTNADLARDLRARGLRRAARFTWDACASATRAVYDRVLAAAVH